MKRFIIAALAATAVTTPAWGDNSDVEQLKEELKRLQMQMKSLEKRLEQAESESDEASATAAAAAEQAAVAQNEAEAAKPDIKVGGAVRFQYAYRDFNEAQTEREGNLELDTVRLNFDGEIGDVILSAEYRFYEYMDVIHHGWFGYNFADVWQAQVGFHRVPFGILPYNSNNFFFSSNYYIGFEDDYDAGIKFIGDYQALNVQFAYYANDEITFGARNERYSYDILRDNSGNELEENNQFNLRLAHTLQHSEGSSSEIGFSTQFGWLADKGTSAGVMPARAATGEDVGDNLALALHLHGDYGPWGLMLQAMTYDYDMDNGDQILGVGAYAFDDTIAAEADSYTANISYDWPIAFGAISGIRFYNDFSYVTNKSANLAATWQNVLGAAISAGGLYTYVDLVRAKNQPFIGGTMTGDGDEETRFNINFGYYF